MTPAGSPDATPRGLAAFIDIDACFDMKTLLSGSLLAMSLSGFASVAASTPQPPLASTSRNAVPLALVLPTRRAPDAPPAQPPLLPDGAEHITPLTFEAIVRRQPAAGPAQTVSQSISRTVDRVHVATSDGREWLFERNTRDPRRVSGYLVEPAARAIIVYEESNLRNALGIRGWADVLMVGFDPTLLDGLRRTGTTRTIEGIRFVRYEPARGATSTREAWWSDDELFASSFVRRDDTGSTRFAVKRVQLGVDAALLQLPPVRFPAYRVVDFADWLEGH
jgi:hypothetical protein